MSMPKVSVITVICGNNIDFMCNCLKSLINYTDYPNVEFIVVTNTNNEMINRISDLSEYNTLIKPVHRNKKHSNASNRNLGALHASPDSKYYLFADSDVMYSDDQWLTNLVTISEEHEDIGLIGGGEDTTLGHYCWIDETFGLLINVVLGFDDVTPDHPFEMMVIPGYSMLMRKSVFTVIGGWDEGFLPVYGEDIDICLRCILSGYRVFGVFNKGVNHLYRNSKENNSCELLKTDDNQLLLNTASIRRLAIKYDNILPKQKYNSYQEWLEYVKLMRINGRKHLSELIDLPSTVIDGKISSLYLPLKHNEQMSQIYDTVLFE